MYNDETLNDKYVGFPCDINSPDDDNDKVEENNTDHIHVCSSKSTTEGTATTLWRHGTS